jgi:hypothetical protein
MNQHFIPKMLLKNFVDRVTPGNHGVWIRQRGSETWERRGVKEVAALSNYYSIPADDGSLDDTLETSHFQKLESMATPIVRHYIEDRLPITPPQPYDVFVTFIANLICRHPKHVDRVKALAAAHAKDELRRKLEDPESFRRLSALYEHDTGKPFPHLVDPVGALDRFEVSIEHWAGVGFSMLGVDFMARRLGSAHVTFLCAPEGAAFVTGDVPYASHSKGRNQEAFYIPLSPRTAAVFSWHAEPRYVYHPLDAGLVDQINSEFLPYQSYIISSRADVVDTSTLSKWLTGEPQ